MSVYLNIFICASISASNESEGPLMSFLCCYSSDQLFDTIGICRYRNTLFLLSPHHCFITVKFRDKFSFFTADVTSYCSYARPAVFDIGYCTVIHCDAGGVSLVGQ